MSDAAGEGSGSVEQEVSASPVPFMENYNFLLWTTVIAYITYYLINVVKKPVLACDDKLRDWLTEHVPVVNEKFWPTIWCFQSHCQTIVRSLLKTFPEVQYQREILKLPDGGQVALDWAEPEDLSLHADPDTRPTILILPGLVGSSQESYSLHYVRQVQQLGYRAVVFNNRGNAGVKLVTGRTYNACNSEDLNCVVDHIKIRFPDSPLMGAGISLGGIILTQYLAKKGHECKMVAGMTVSIAFEVFESYKTLEEPLNVFCFNRLLTKSLVNSVFRNKHHFEGNPKYDMQWIAKSQTIREFDNRFTAIQFGYPSWKEYYTDACVTGKLEGVKVPLVCLNSADDPFSPAHAIPYEEAEKSKHVALVVTSHGGHIGFLEGILPRNSGYMDRLFAQYVDAVFRHGEELMKNQ